MDNAVTLKPTNELASNGFGARMAALPVRDKFNMAMGIALLIAVVVALLLWNRDGDYKLLYANLSDKDGGAVIEKLSAMNIPYRHSDGGRAILVPASKVEDARMKLATAGLPKASVSGYELMDNPRFGMTAKQETLIMQRGLEGELSRSISSLAAVESARVHLALPNQNGFFREQQKPSASVVLSLHAGRTLDRSQVAGIVHLVSSSVPEMNAKAVSVLDQTGALISSAPESSQHSGLSDQQLQYVAQIEQGHTKRIAELLEPVVGRENLRANVTADVDFSQVESTEEAFEPNQGASAPATVRSQQTTERTGTSPAQASGTPGAASNQPPVPATAPITGAAQPLQAGQAGGTVGSSQREATTNFEVNKSVRVTRNATGTVKRLNAAVVVNHRSVTDAKGKTTQVPLTTEELDKLTALVQESIGYNKDRGDSVRVINAPFKVDPVTVVETPIWKQPELIDMLRAALVPVSLALVAAFVFFGMIRPSLNAALAPPVPVPGANVEATVDDPLALPGLPAPTMQALEAPTNSVNLDAARNLAKQNPAAVAQIVRGWVNGQPA